PNAAPIYFGFAMDDFDRERLSRAVLEGHVLNLWSGFRKLPVRPTAIHLTGGLSRSPAWCQMIADMFEAETVPVEGEGAALGAAIHAAWVCAKEQGQKVSLAEVAEPFVVLDVARRKTPIARNVEIYRIQKRLYLALSERARGIDTDDDPFALRWRLGG
ncbi:MAG: FGGY-family carbohydrate kinase, partial [Gemmatimonadota bacterium]|nr:FGGY-family carbohydrate kinase [Gemmatimonadota bacterium]